MIPTIRKFLTGNKKPFRCGLETIINRKTSQQRITRRSKMFEDRIPPSNIEAERQILSAMLLNSDVMYNMIADLEPDYFYHKIHKDIFTAIKKHKTQDIAVINMHIDDPNCMLGEILELGAFRDCSGSIEILRDNFIRREAIVSTTRSLVALYQNNEITATDIINTLQSGLYKNMLGKNQFQPERVGDILPRVIDQLSRVDSQNRHASTGIKTIDDLLYIDKSDLVVIGARPSMGKSAFASQIIRHNAKNGKTCLFFSVEMSTEMETRREVFSEGEINYHLYQTGVMPQRDYTKIQLGAGKLFDLPIYIDSEPGITPNKIRAKCNYVKATQGLDLIVVDYLTLCKPDQSLKSIREEVTENIKEFKSIAKYFDVPFIVLSQLSRMVDNRTDKRPVKADLMESGAIEAVADIILFLYRDYVYTRKEETKNMCEIICAKQRNGEADWLKKIYCDLTIGKFADIETGF